MTTINTTGKSTRNSTQTAGAQTHRGPFAIMTVLFFMWGFITVLNDILIPRLQDAFVLTNYKIMFIQTAFFGAYFIGSLLYFIISATAGDPIAKIGYKNGVVIGLLLAALGSAMFWPAATGISYPLFLVALFIVGLGLAMLQIAANPYVTILGPERTASSRLNLAQAFNSVGTTIGPLIGGYLIFQYFAKTGAHGADSVKVPYLMFCIAFLILAAFFFFLHLPHVGEGKIEPGAGALKHPHVLLGVLAIFMYVGGEVSVGSNIIKFLGQPNIANMTEIEAKNYVSLFWGGMLIGRFMGAIELSEMKKAKKQVLLVVIPLLAYVFLWAAISAPLDALHGGSSLHAVFALWNDQFVQNLERFQNLSSAGRALLAAFPVRQSARRTNTPDFFNDHRRAARHRDYFRRQTGDVVCRRCRTFHIHWLAEHFLAGPRRHGHLQEPGFVAPGHGDSWRRNFASPHGQARGCLEPAGFLHRAADCLCLRRLLRFDWP